MADLSPAPSDGRMAACEHRDAEPGYFCSFPCVTDYLMQTNEALWLRDSSRHPTWIQGQHISRCVTDDSGRVLAIWNGSHLGWRLRMIESDGNDVPVEPDAPQFIRLTEASLFQQNTRVE